MEKKLTQTVLRILELYIKQRDSIDTIVLTTELRGDYIYADDGIRTHFVPQLEFNLFMIQNTAK